MTNMKNIAKKIPPWAWAISGLLVGLVIAWIAIEYVSASGQPSNSVQSSAGNGQPATAETNPSNGSVPEPQANPSAVTNEELAQEETTNAQLQAAQNNATLAEETTQMMGMMGKTLDDYYNEVRSAQGIGSIPCMYGSQCETDFWVAFAEQALGENSLNLGIVGPKSEATYHSLTNSYTYVDAKKQLDELVFAPYGADVQSTDSDQVKISKILGFIDAHIHYEYDMSETPQAPAETLSFGSGDCKDFSILASAALVDAGIPSAIMRMKNVSGEGSGHAMILIQSSENLPLAESYADLTKYGLPAGRWWVIEPQYTLPEQTQNPSWFAEWEIVHAALVGQTSSGSSVSEASTDAQRVSDLHEVQNGLELYYNAKGVYPTGVSNWSELTNTIAAAHSGVTTLPNDPTRGATYGYASDGTTYVIGAELEDSNNAIQSSLTMPSGLSWMILPEGGQNGTTCGTAGLYCVNL